MAENSDDVLVPQDGSAIYLAPVGTTGPADHAASLNAAFHGVGYISDDAPSMNPADRETSEIRDWLGRLVRIVNQTVTRTITLPLLQTSREALRLAFDGGTFTTAGDGVKFVPGSSVQERAMVIHMVDGDHVVRFHFPRVIVSEVGEVTPSAENGTVWEITFTVGDPGESADVFELYSNLPGLLVEASS